MHQSIHLNGVEAVLICEVLAWRRDFKVGKMRTVQSRGSSRRTCRPTEYNYFNILSKDKKKKKETIISDRFCLQLTSKTILICSRSELFFTN